MQLNISTHSFYTILTMFIFLTTERAVAELQVSGVKTNLKKRPYDTSVTLTVHSLLVVDALQTYGPDFELLMASHRNIT